MFLPSSSYFTSSFFSPLLVPCLFLVVVNVLCVSLVFLSYLSMTDGYELVMGQGFGGLGGPGLGIAGLLGGCIDYFILRCVYRCLRLREMVFCLCHSMIM